MTQYVQFIFLFLLEAKFFFHLRGKYFLFLQTAVAAATAIDNNLGEGEKPRMEAKRKKVPVPAHKRHMLNLHSYLV